MFKEKGKGPGKALLSDILIEAWERKENLEDDHKFCF